MSSMKAIFYILSITLLLACSSNKKVVAAGLQKEIPVVQSKQTYDVIVNEGIVYAEGLSHESINSESAEVIPLKLDIYSPDDNRVNRPVIVLIHGGGFAGGSRKHDKIVNIANYFAYRGWVAVSIDYRLKRDKGTVPQKWIDYAQEVPKKRRGQFLAIYPAHRDAKAALRWIIANAKTYNINTEYITVGGGSAGAITAITLGVSNQEDFRDEIDTDQDSTLASTNLDQNYKIKTILDFWGSKVALDILENIYGHQRFESNDPSLFVAHGTEDPIVSFTKAEELKSLYNTNKVPLAYYPIQGGGHGCWNETFNNKRLEELAFDFVVEQQKLIAE